MKTPLLDLDESRLDRVCFAISRFYGGWRILGRRDYTSLGPPPWDFDITLKAGERVRLTMDVEEQT